MTKNKDLTHVDSTNDSTSRATGGQNEAVQPDIGAREVAIARVIAGRCLDCHTTLWRFSEPRCGNCGSVNLADDSGDAVAYAQTESAFSDREYREAYAAAELDTRLAAQIRVLRDQRGWTQSDLAERAGMKQSRISLMEDVNYSSWSVATLKRLAAAFDLPLVVSFGYWKNVGHGVGRDGLERASFPEKRSGSDGAVPAVESAVESRQG